MDGRLSIAARAGCAGTRDVRTPRFVDCDDSVTVDALMTLKVNDHTKKAKGERGKSKVGDIPPYVPRTRIASISSLSRFVS